MKTIEILVGIPCSGKTRYANNTANCCPEHAVSISRDALREYHFGKKYKQNTKDEKFITDEFHRKMIHYLYYTDIKHIILDNTHCKEIYIDLLISRWSTEHKIKIHFFDSSVLICHLRNIIRYVKIGKWIPIKIINIMNRNYNKINKNKYAKYK